MQEHASENASSVAAKERSRLRKRFGIAAFGALTIALCSGATQCGPSEGEVVGAAVGIGAGLTVIVVVVVHASTNHGITGCVVTGPNGPELQMDDKRYALDGDIASVKVGDRIKVSGSRVKKTKDQTGDQVYRVEKIKKDYGPCPVKPAA